MAPWKPISDANPACKLVVLPVVAVEGQAFLHGGRVWALDDPLGLELPHLQLRSQPGEQLSWNLGWGLG